MNPYLMSDEALQAVSSFLDHPPWGMLRENPERLSAARRELSMLCERIKATGCNIVQNGEFKPMPVGFQEQFLWKIDLTLKAMEHLNAPDILESVLERANGAGIVLWFDEVHKAWCIDAPGVNPFRGGSTPEDALLNLRVLIVSGKVEVPPADPPADVLSLAKRCFLRYNGAVWHFETTGMFEDETAPWENGHSPEVAISKRRAAAQAFQQRFS